MQIYALDHRDNLIPAQRAQRQVSYSCPECLAPLRLRGGQMRQLHFYHLESTSCPLHSKSLIHLHTQYRLQKMLAPETILIEHRFPQIGRIADVVWPAQKLIFEVQVSPISAQEVAERMRDYARAGYQVIWILHDRRFNRFHLSAAENLLRCSPHYFTNMNPWGQGIFYDQYASIYLQRRIRRTPRFPVHFKQIIQVDLKQFPRQFPQERKKWPLSFGNDLSQQPLIWPSSKKTLFNPFRPLFRFYRILLQLLLEKTTY